MYIIGSNPILLARNLTNCLIWLKQHFWCLEILGCSQMVKAHGFDPCICRFEPYHPSHCSRAEIDKAEEYINAAIMIEPRGVYYYFWAYLRQDFYARKFLRIQPTYKDLIVEARNRHVTPAEINQLFDVLSVELPNALHCISN